MRNWHLIAEQPGPAPHLARTEGRATLTHMCKSLCSVSAVLASFSRMDWISASHSKHKRRSRSHKGPYVGVSRVRSWSRVFVLGAILWAFIAKY